jgi:hypothetical protein
MARTATLDEATLVGIAKQVALKAFPTEEITSIVYNYDESKVLSTADQNKLLKFVYESSQKWQKPKSTHDMIADIMNKIGSGSRKDSKTRYGSNKPMTKDELVAIHAWVMNPNRK